MYVCILLNNSKTAELIGLYSISLSLSWSRDGFRLERSGSGLPETRKKCFGTIRYSNKFSRFFHKNFEDFLELYKRFTNFRVFNFLFKIFF